MDSDDKAFLAIVLGGVSVGLNIALVLHLIFCRRKETDNETYRCRTVV